MLTSLTTADARRTMRRGEAHTNPKQPPKTNGTRETAKEIILPVGKSSSYHEVVICTPGLLSSVALTRAAGQSTAETLMCRAVVSCGCLGFLLAAESQVPLTLLWFVSHHYREENAGVWLKFNKNKDTKIFLPASQTP